VIGSSLTPVGLIAVSDETFPKPRAPIETLSKGERDFENKSM
jgi:hypothetical protein